MYHLMQKNIEFVEKEYGVKDVHLEITDYYYLYRTYPKIADELWNHPENYITGELVEGAKEFYQELVDLVGEDKIQIVTSSMKNVIPLKDKMLKEKFGINCKIVHSIFGKHKKHEFTKNTLLIDDFVGNIRDHFMYNLNYGIVFNHMNLDYIKQECNQEGILHVTTFKELIEKVKFYLEELNNLNKSYSRNVPTNQGGYMVKSTGVICEDGKSATFYTSVLKDTIHNCPYCKIEIPESSIDKKLIADARISEEASFICDGCDNEIFITYQWICDVDCPSNGIEVFNLETEEDYRN